jgi:hypothetical protein
MKLGIEALLPMLLTVGSLCTVSGQLLADGQINWQDVGTIFGSLEKFAGIGKLQPGVAVSEALELDQNEHAECVKAFKSELTLPSGITEEGVELLVDASLEVLVAFAKMKQAVQLLGIVSVG